MITIIILCGFLGFYLLYCTSERAVFYDGLGLQSLANNYSTLFKYMGLGLLFLCLALSVYHWGWGTGLVAYFVWLMTVASMVVLLAPLKVINRSTVLATLLAVLVIEYFLI